MFEWAPQIKLSMPIFENALFLKGISKLSRTRRFFKEHAKLEGKQMFERHSTFGWTRQYLKGLFKIGQGTPNLYRHLIYLRHSKILKTLKGTPKLSRSIQSFIGVAVYLRQSKILESTAIFSRVLQNSINMSIHLGHIW